MGLGVILNCFFRALGQIGDSRFAKVLVLGVGLTIALLIGATAGLVWLVNTLTGGSEITWLNDILGWGSVILMLVLSIFLMVPVASAITSLFLDEVAQAVEDKHYKHLPRVAPVPFPEALKDTMNFLGVLVAANLVAILLYFFMPPLAPFIFWGLNGFLLGREYFTLAAMRRVGREGARELRARNSGTIWMAGVLMAIPLSFPLINLLVPILGAATFTHLFHATQENVRPS